jgi:hypothetical protein
MRGALATALLLILAALPAGAQGYRFGLEEVAAYGVQNSTAVHSKALALEAVPVLDMI